MASSDCYVGIDISKTHLDVAIYAPREYQQVPYDCSP